MAYENTVGTPTMVLSTMLDALHAFIRDDVIPQYPGSWSILESNDGDYTSGNAGKPLVVQHMNGIPADDVVIHIWRRLSKEIGMNISTGFVGTGGANPATASLWYNQTGARLGASNDADARDVCCRTSYSQDIVQYFFHGFADLVYVVYQCSDGVWRNFSFGHVNKIDEFDGAGYCSAVYNREGDDYADNPDDGYYSMFFDNYLTTSTTGGEKHCQQVRNDNTSGGLRYILGTASWDAGDRSNTVGKRTFGANDIWGSSGQPYSNHIGGDFEMTGYEYAKLTYAPTTFSLVSPLVPIYLYVYRGSDSLSIYASLPHVFALNIKSINEGSEIDIQGTKYNVYPVGRKTNSKDQDGSNIPNTYYWGFCVEKEL